MPAVGGTILINRLIWLGIGSAFLVLGIARYRFAEPGLSKKRRKDAAAEAGPAPVPAPARPLPGRSGSAAAAQLWTRTRFEMKQVFRSPAFAVLVALGMINTIASLWFSREMFGTPIFPVTSAIIPIV